ncbi:molybdopterin-dependent oxidoreductase [bacterium]|nr:molybdopterin-dependent oxidoreductase [candidate division CSSED10-310 bacterium]
MNSRHCSLPVTSREMLLDVLRNRLELTGAKRGCSSGSCGACTIVVNGSAVRSCRYPAFKADGCEIITVEGLAEIDTLHPLQAAFLSSGAVQCGYCTPGMLMSAYALLLRNARPDRTDVRRALKGNLCRCTGYLPIENAVLAAAESLRNQTAPRDTGWGVGQSPWRIDGIEKVTGRALFSADYNFPDMVHAAPVWTPVPSGRIVNIEPNDALAIPGVIRVLTWKDIPGLNAVGRWKADRPVLAEHAIRFWGDCVALVIAQSPETARAAAGKVIVKTVPVPGIYSMEDALEPGASPIWETGNTASAMVVKKEGKPDAENQTAIVEDRFETGFIEHALLETEAAVAHIDSDGVLTVIGPSQNVFFDRLELMRILGIPPRQSHRIRVIQAHTGGAFGKREDMIAQPLAALACWITRRPAKVVLNREESFRSTTKRHPVRIIHRSAVDSTGRVRSLEIDLKADTGAYASWAPNILRKSLVHSTGPYDIPSVRLAGQSVYTNSAFSGAMRGFGATQSLLAAEYHMNHIAGMLKMDPLEFRIKNALVNHSQTATGQELTGTDALPPVLHAAARRFRWPGPARGRQVKGNISIGYGIAGAFYGIGYGNGIPDKGQAEIRIDPDGNAHLATGAVDYGQGSSTVLLQIALETLGTPRSSAYLETGDTKRTPDSGSTVASRQTFVTGNAVLKACTRLKQILLPVAADLLKADPQTIEIHSGKWKSRGHGEISWNDLISEAFRRNLNLVQKARYFNPTEPLDPSTGQGDVYRTYAFAAACSEVSVNLKNGKIRVIRMTCAHDSGRIIHPELAKSQVTGGAVMAAGLVLSEEYRVKEGIPQTLDFNTYQLMRFGDVPDIDVVFVETPDPLGPMGAKGLGEPATLAAAPAILNAVTDAAGIQFNRIPVTPEILLSKLPAR